MAMDDLIEEGVAPVIAGIIFATVYFGIGLFIFNDNGEWLWIWSLTVFAGIAFLIFSAAEQMKINMRTRIKGRGLEQINPPFEALIVKAGELIMEAADQAEREGKDFDVEIDKTLTERDQREKEQWELFWKGLRMRLQRMREEKARANAK